MSQMHSQSGIVQVDGADYEWELQREPQWSDVDGWIGMAVSLLQKDMKRGALLDSHRRNA